MLLYPQPFDHFPSHWLDEVTQMTDLKDLVQLEKKYHQGLIKDTELYHFYEEIEELTHFPQPAFSPPPMPEERHIWLKIVPKKQHEIKKLAPLINHYYHSHAIERMIDIGGGVGLFSQRLTHAYQLKITSLDMNKELQESGKKRYLKNAIGEKKLEYKQVTVSDSDPLFLNELSPQVMTVGLHTCGPLAVSQILASAAKSVRSIVNFGCCYLKLSEQGHDQNISQFAKSFASPLIMNQFALTLACGPHRKISHQGVAFKQVVKHYRYGLHILLVELYPEYQLTTFGNSPTKVYDGDFANYVTAQFQKLSLTLKHTAEELNAFYCEKLFLIKRMYAAGFIRDALSRVLEVYLLLDRAIYLEEKGYSVEILEVFDEEISPRNLGIFAHSK